MGHFSELQYSMYDTGHYTELDTFVCKECVADDALADLVEENLTSEKCDYCGAVGDEKIATSMNIVMERVDLAISSRYADAQDINMPWVEGGWLMPQKEMYDILPDFDPGWPCKLFEDILDSFDPMLYWVEHNDGDWAELQPNKTLAYGWDRFREQVLTKTRYLFLNEPDDSVDAGRPDHIPIAMMLDTLGIICTETDLVKIRKEGSLFYRVRIDKDKSKFTEFEEMGVPPSGVASAGRMNPAGISYFYTALDEETAKKEVLTEDAPYCLATFQNKKELRLIDFVNLPPMPSIFDIGKNNERNDLLFLKELKDDLIKPVSKDGMEHVEYVPTQIISEYFRYRFLDYDGTYVDGFIYPSVKNSGGINIVIFDSDNESIKKKFEMIDIQGPLFQSSISREQHHL